MTPVTWHTPGRILYDCPQGAITQEIAEASNDMILRLLNSQSNPPLGGIHLILDFQQATEIPRNLTNATQTLKYMRHPALGWTIMITENQIQRMFASVLAQIFRVRFKMVGSMEEALAFLYRQDPTLEEYLAKLSQSEE